MSDFVPFILKNEQDKIKGEIAGRIHVCVTFDGTMRLGEAMAVLVCFVSDDWTTSFGA